MGNGLCGCRFIPIGPGPYATLLNPVGVTKKADAFASIICMPGTCPLTGGKNLDSRLYLLDIKTPLRALTHVLLELMRIINAIHLPGFA